MKITLPVVTKKLYQGYVIYRGPSRIDGKRIVVVITNLKRFSRNSKTGEMAQIYILRDRYTPVKAAWNDEDYAICGDCKHRPLKNGTCYVNISKGPWGVYTGLINKSYPKVKLDKLSKLSKIIYNLGLNVRVGAYGDPAAVPLYVWDKILKYVKHTAYTHQWHKLWAKPYKKYCMASVDTVEEFNQARKLGWRTFRIRKDKNDSLLSGEFECPASAEQNHRLDCNTCMACSGGKVEKASVAIIVHGIKWKVDTFKGG